MLEDPSMGKAAKYMSLIMMLLILASCVGFVLASVPQNQYIEEDEGKCEEDQAMIDVDCSLCWDSHDDLPILDGRCDVCVGMTDLATAPIRKVCKPQELRIFILAETVCIYCFTVDYLLRVGTVASVGVERWNGDPEKIKSCGSKIYNYSTGWLNCVDLVAIMPFWIEVAVGTGVPLGFLRVLRLARVFRIFKLGKYNEGMSLFARTLHASIPALSLLCFFVLIGVVLFGSIIFFVEGGTYTVDASVCPESLGYACYVRPNGYSGEDMEQSPFVSIPYSFYWVMVTMTTVGYGDQFPQTGLGKFITICCMLCGILTLALPITVLGSNFTAEYEALHGEEEDKEAEEDKFWEHFASLVASSMSPENGKANGGINSQATRDRLRMLMIDNAGGALADTLSSSGSPVSLRKSSGLSGVGGPVSSDAVSQLEQTIVQLQRTLETLKKSNAGDVFIQELESGSSSPVNFQIQNKVTSHGASGALSNMFNEKQVRKSRPSLKPIVLSGSGHLPNYFDIFSPKKLKDRNQFDFAPNTCETNEAVVADDIAEMEKLVGVSDQEERKKKVASVISTPGQHTLNLRRGSIGGTRMMKLKQVGKSLSFGQRLMKVKKYDQSLGCSSKKLEIQIVGAKGVDRVEGCRECDGLSISVVAGATQFETKQSQGEDGEEILFGDKFEYEVPLSTHSGNMLVKNVEIIAHFGDKVVGVVVVPLTSVCGRESEFRLTSSNNGYLHNRNLKTHKNRHITYAGMGRVNVVLGWGDCVQEEHKFGTSFAMLLKKGAKTERLGEKAFRSPPVYPKVLLAKKKKQSSSAADIVVHSSGEAFYFEEASSNSSGSGRAADIEVEGLVFPSSSSDEGSYCSPTESPGRSDTEKASSTNEEVEVEMRMKRARELKKHYRVEMVEEFMHNKKSPKMRDGIRKGGFGAMWGGNKIGIKYEEL